MHANSKMGQRSCLYTAVFTENRIVLAPPAVINQSAVFEAGRLTPMTYERNLLDPVFEGQQSMYVQAVRFWSNFADGLVFTSSESPNAWSTPEIVLYKSDTIPPLPLNINPHHLSFQTSNLNEWIPVEKPLPGISNNNAAPIFAVISGAWQFETISINPAYAGKEALFGIQALISVSNY